MKPFSQLNIPTMIHPTTSEVVEAEATEEGELTGRNTEVSTLCEMHIAPPAQETDIRATNAEL